MNRDIKVSVLIPAYDEVERISKVLAAVSEANLPDEIIVIDDGSTDGTAEKAIAYPNVRLIQNRTNLGKHGAMYRGASVAQGEYLLFLDADLCNLTPQGVDALIEPIISQEAHMSISYRKGESILYKYIVPLEPILSGERCLRKKDYFGIKNIQTIKGYEFEVLCNKYFLDQEKNIQIVPIEKLHNTRKIEKMGFWKGLKKETLAMAGLFFRFGGIEILRQFGRISFYFQWKRWTSPEKVAKKKAMQPILLSR